MYVHISVSDPPVAIGLFDMKTALLAEKRDLSSWSTWKHALM